MTVLRAEVQALADMRLNRMLLELIHPLVCGMVCYFCTDVPGSNARYSRLLSHTPLNTHSFTRIHGFAQHSARWTMLLGIDLVKGSGLRQTHNLFWVTTVTLHIGTLMDLSCWKVLCTITHKRTSTHTNALGKWFLWLF